MTLEMEYLHQLFMLHRLIDLGLDEELADNLRDEMDVTGKQLTDKEMARLDQVSARLNAERDVNTSIQTDRIKELDSLMTWLSDEHWNRKNANP